MLLSFHASDLTIIVRYRYARMPDERVDTIETQSLPNKYANCSFGGKQSETLRTLDSHIGMHTRCDIIRRILSGHDYFFDGTLHPDTLRFIWYLADIIAHVWSALCS